MSLTIHGNKLASIANRAVTLASAAQERALQRLSTGQVAPSARYDAAGLAVSSRIRGEIAGLKTYVNNATQGVALLQTAEGAYQRVQDMLNRMRSLATQAGSSQLSATERGMLDTEYQQIKLEITRLAKGTNFNGVNLFDASAPSFAGTAYNNNAAGYAGVQTLNTDFNGDGYLDVITADLNGDVSVSYGNSDGSLQASVVLFNYSNDLIENITIADFDGDGRQEIIISDASFSGEIYRFNGASYAATGTNVGYFGPTQVGDLDNDGRQELYYVDGGGSVSRWRLTGSGYTSSVVAAPTISVGGIRIGDVDNNGQADLVVFNNGGFARSILNNNGSFSLSSIASVSATGNDAQLLDVNGDGVLDFVGITTAGASIRLGTGGGTFASSGTTISLSAAAAVKVMDVNGDGLYDVVGIDGTGSLRYRLATSTTSYATVVTVAGLLSTSPGFSQMLNLVDLNKDGKLDLSIQGGNDIFSIINTGSWGLEGNVRTSGNPSSSANVSMRIGSIRLNLLDQGLATSAINSLGGAKRAEQSIKNALNILLQHRTYVGAATNRLEKVLDNVATMIENQEGARGAIADVDVASEMSSFVANQVTLQAGISMLAQANQTPKLLIELFKKQ